MYVCVWGGLPLSVGAGRDQKALDLWELKLGSFELLEVGAGNKS